jgi:hypothetical protein
VIVRQDWWGAIADWFADQSTTSLCAGWSLLVAVAFCLLGYAVIRRATP